MVENFCLDCGVSINNVVMRTRPKLYCELCKKRRQKFAVQQHLIRKKLTGGKK
tara:strand:+ start:170 stop:328 length:159 start_codon:yes stop_codon:yes gene_type:complete